MDGVMDGWMIAESEGEEKKKRFNEVLAGVWIGQANKTARTMIGGPRGVDNGGGLFVSICCGFSGGFPFRFLFSCG